MTSALISEWKTVGRSGPTVDGRHIEPEWLIEAAEDYDPDLFTALIWPDHLRWFNLGKVPQIRTAGNSEGGVDMLARLAPNDSYLAANRAGQRLFTSMELQPDFRGSGRYYLTGLGATDDPASAATSEVRFSRIGDQQVLVAQPREIVMGTLRRPEGPHNDPHDDQPPRWFRKLFTGWSPAAPAAPAAPDHDPTEDDDMSKEAIEALQQQVTTLAEQFSRQFPGSAAGDAGEGDDSPAVARLTEQFSELKALLAPVVAKFAADQGDAPNDGPNDNPNNNPNNNQGDQPAGNTQPASEFAALKQQLDELTEKFNAALTEQPGTAADENTGGDDLSDYI